MEIFRLAGFEPDRHLTLRIKGGTVAARLFGEVACTYLIVPQESRSCRLIVKLAVRYPRGLLGGVMRAVLPWGDLVMMRRQLLNLKGLAEATPA
jgi:hypothetical protein